MLVPASAPDIYDYSCSVPYFQSSINVQPLVQDSEMKVTVNESAEIKPISIAVGDTLIRVLVISPDGTKSQVYSVTVTREQLPFCVTFMDIQEQMAYECPVSLTAFYRPVSVRGSDPKHTMSGPYMDILTRRSKRDPLDETILSEDWRVPEYELDLKMSSANVTCCFFYRGCRDIVHLTDCGNHVRSCQFKPLTELDAKAVTESKWYKEGFATSNASESHFKHTLQERNWEKRLQQVHNSDIDKLCSQAEEHVRLYRKTLPKPGDVLSYKDGMSPLDSLHQAAACYASAIKLQPKNATFHFHLATVLEEFYYAAEIYGLRRKRDSDETDISSAKATGKDEEVQAICKLHGFSGRPSLEQQLKALDLEYQQLKEQGQSSRADYIQNLYAWKSKQAGKSGVMSLDEENPLTQAFLKYKDALSLDLNNWQYNLHVGRHLLLQKQAKEALKLLESALALRPASAIARCYVGLALLEQDGGAGARTEESLTYLQQGMEKLLSDLVAQERTDHLLAENPLCLLNAQLLSGFVKFAKAIKNISNGPSFMSPTQVLHTVADWSVKALCQCPHQGLVTQDLEWALLEACFGLLELLIEETDNKEDWIMRRCQALSALLRLTTIPRCKRLLNMHEKVCQLGVISSPCNSSALYLLGVAQLAQYDDRSSSEEAEQVLEDAKRSFQASISLENLPNRGPPPADVIAQKWWQEWKASEEIKKQKQLSQANVDKPLASPAGPARGAPKGRGAVQVSRGATASKPGPSTKRGSGAAQGGATAASRGTSTKTETARGNTTRFGPTTTTTRGRGSAVLSKSAAGAFSKPPSQATGATTIKAAESQIPEKPAALKDHPPTVPDQACTRVPVNRSSFLHRLGLARALSRHNETAARASDLYREVITMAPEAYDAYTELAEILVKDDPLGAVEVYSLYPQKPLEEQTFDDAFIPGEIVRLLMKCEKYDDPRLPANMISYGKVMGIGCLEKYINILEAKFKTNILKRVYAGIHSKSEEDSDLQEFFRFKCWI
ncbi:uncharacterized protein [Hyperolius riggenbachi]